MSTVVLQDVETGIWGCGQDEAEAAEDLRQAWRDHRDVLERAGRLSPGMERELEILRARDPQPEGL